MYLPTKGLYDHTIHSAFTFKLQPHSFSSTHARLMGKIWCVNGIVQLILRLIKVGIVTIDFLCNVAYKPNTIKIFNNYNKLLQSIIIKQLMC